jgi:hypothetical protein
MDKMSGAKAGNGPKCNPTPANQASAAGAAKVKTTTQSNPSSTGARPQQSGNKG